MSLSMRADPLPAMSAATNADVHPRRWRMLVLLAVAELLGMSLWFAASAVSVQLGARWQLSASSLGWLTAIVQLGFVLGTAMAALLNIADIVPARLLFSVSAVIGAIANATLLLSASYRGVLVCRLVTGFALAGVYPPAMKMISTCLSESQLGVVSRSRPETGVTGIWSTADSMDATVSWMFMYWFRCIQA